MVENRQSFLPPTTIVCFQAAGGGGDTPGNSSWGVPPGSPNPGKAWVALGKFLEEFVYLAVKICRRGTLPSATPSFQVGKKL